jgi:hypothetical protein
MPNLGKKWLIFFVLRPFFRNFAPAYKYNKVENGFQKSKKALALPVWCASYGDGQDHHVLGEQG